MDQNHLQGKALFSLFSYFYCSQFVDLVRLLLSSSSIYFNKSVYYHFKYVHYHLQFRPECTWNDTEEKEKWDKSVIIIL